MWYRVHDALRSTKALATLTVPAVIFLAVGIPSEGPELGWKEGVAVLAAMAFAVAILVYVPREQLTTRACSKR